MKYRISNEVIPQINRKEINDKILHIVDQSLEIGISREDIFNAYTGDGGLHGLNFKDFENRFSFSEAKKEIEQGQFFTPHNICKFLVECLKPKNGDITMDMCCGMANFANYLIEHNFYGNELDIKGYKLARYLYPDAQITAGDIRFYEPGIRADIVFGNPPYNLKWKVNKDEYLSQFYYCLKAAELLKPAGLMVLIVPDSFLSDTFIDGGMIKAIDQRFNFIGQFDLPMNAFKSMGVDSFKTKVMFLQKKSKYLEPKPYTIDKIPTPELTEQGAQWFYTNYLKGFVDQKEAIKGKLYFENVNSWNSTDEADFQYKVKKMLFAIKQHPVIASYYGKCLGYLDKYNNQEKPEGMTWEEWEKSRITKNKVLAYLKRTLQKQSKQEHDEIRLVKTQYGLKLKGYSQKNKIYLSKYSGTQKMSINQMIIEGNYPFEDKTYRALIERKIKAYERENVKFKERPTDLNLAKYLNDFSLMDSSNGQIIRLNALQKEDLNKVLQKHYDILNWQMGSGKTLAGIAWYKYLLSQDKVRNIVIVSAALSINLTWDVMLGNFGENYIQIKSLRDIEKIQPGQVIIISSDMLIKYQRQLKKFVRMQSQKVALIFDESDELTNGNSQRTKAALNCFRKVKYKLETTGTTTRNNINELYSQLELLYNNSVNMLCECEYIYKFNKDKKLVKTVNPYFMQPFPAYHGKSLFKSCFSPHKITVFGVKKDNQDIYNMVHLQDIIEKTIITRTFKEIVGRDIYNIVNHKVRQNMAEREVYKVIVEQFFEMLYLFRSTGNARKDSLLKIIRQIQLLIKATSIPHKFKEYQGSDLPNKYLKIFSLLEDFKDEKVAIGTVFIDTAKDYYEKLAELFPERPIYLIKGDVSFKKRKGIIRQFEASKNGILISTQQSLKSSVNIPTCNKVILESLQWNISKMSQYYFRFIRFNSMEPKEVHFVTYDQTIEQNLVALVMAKERINEYIKTLSFKDQKELYNEFGVDLDILESLMEKEIDEKGHVRLTWGQQQVV